MKKILERHIDDGIEYYMADKMSLDICMNDLKTYFSEIVNAMLGKKKMDEDTLFFCIDRICFHLGLVIPEDTKFGVKFEDVQNDDLIDKEVW